MRDVIIQEVGFEVLLGDSTFLGVPGPRTWTDQTKVRAGRPVAAHIVAGGKAILAFSSPKVVERLVAAGLTSLTPNSITDPEVLKKRLAEYRRTGLAYDLGECDLDYHFVAAPVFDYTKRPVAAVVTGDLAYRVKGRFAPKVLAALKDTASKISARLLYTRSP